MNLSARDGIILIAVIGVLVFLFARLPDFKNEQATSRQYVLEDRASRKQEKAAALAELRDCLKNADETYHANWTRACNLDLQERLNQCFSDGVPEKVCRSKIVFNPDCTISLHKADMISGYWDTAKTECRAMYQLELQ